MTVNHDVLRRTLAYVIEHPDEHDQSSWGYRFDAEERTYLAERARPVPACGTVFCLAGHAAVTVGGAQPVWTNGADGSLEWVIPPDRDATDDDEWVDVSVYASDLLGLDADQAAWLFSGGNTLVRLAQLVYEFTDGAVDLRAEAAATQARELAAPDLLPYRPSEE